MEDWTVLVRNAIAAVIILAAIALVMFLAFLGIHSADKGGQRLSESVTALDSRTMETYSQTTVSGTTALAAAKNYRNTDIAVIIITGKGTGNGSSRNYCARFGTWSSDTSFTPVSVALNFTWTKNATGDAVILNNYVVNADYQNNDLRDAQTKTSTVYVNPSARFKSCIIYNANGDGIGILLVQTTLTTRATTLP